MNWKKIITWSVVIFIGWFIITNPHAAAHAVSGAINGLKHVGSSLATFFTSL